MVVSAVVMVFMMSSVCVANPQGTIVYNKSLLFTKGGAGTRIATTLIGTSGRGCKIRTALADHSARNGNQLVHPARLTLGAFYGRYIGTILDQYITDCTALFTFIFIYRHGFTSLWIIVLIVSKA